MKNIENTMWEEEFDKDFTLEENGCSDCITESLFYKNKTCYDLNELKDFISKTISQEREKIIEEFKKQIEDIDCCCEEGCTASIEFKDELLHLIQK